MGVEYKVISIGTLSKNYYWNEPNPVRTPHATTTLVISGDKKILVDPALPPQVLNARLFERMGIRNKDITTVFLTTFRSAHRGALEAYDHAKWYVHEKEIEYARQHLEDLYHRTECNCGHDHGHDQSHEHHTHPDQDDIHKRIANDLQLLNRCQPAPEKLAPQVEIFPSPGASAGCCGLLLTPTVGAILIAGDAIINQEYLENGRVWEESIDLKLAQQSMADILEVADVIIPGHDNLIPLLGKLL
jgi:hypothetical protein